jgi:hypothetical protein
VNASYFFIGSAAQNINPPGLFDINTHWEQIHNLGWKLALSLKHRASPRLLDTFEIESQFKTEEALNLSNAFIQLIKKQETESSNHLGYNASLVKELSYQLNRYRACFIGNSFFSNNILNYSPTLDIPDEDEGTGSFVFVGPDDKKSLAGPGCLAPNAKLKPYTFFHLLLNATSSANIKGPDEVKNAPIAEVQPPCTSTSAQNPPSPSSERRERSNSATSRQLIPAKWSVLPRIQKSKRSSNSKPSQLKRQSSTTDTILDRWKSIKPNHFQLHKAIQSSCQNHCTFTILVFCGSLTDPESFEKIQTFHKLLDSPTSFYHRYSDESFFKHATSSPLYIHHRASVSSLASLNNVQQHYKAGSTSSSHIPYRKSVSSDHRDSSSFEEDRRSSSDSSSTSASTSEKNQLFSLLFVSSSTKNEALQFLTTTHPSIVHTCFPDGLAKVFLDHDQQCYKAYDVKQNLEIVVIRPDGYIGTRVHEPDSFDQLCMYFDSFLRPPVDMYTAAAVVAAGYDC